MNTLIVTPDVLNSPHAQQYFTTADRRVMVGLRACLEILDIPVPDYAKRKMPGVSPAKSTLAAYYGDNPAQRSNVVAARHTNATPARIAEVQALHSPRG